MDGRTSKHINVPCLNQMLSSLDEVIFFKACSLTIIHSICTTTALPGEEQQNSTSRSNFMQQTALR